MIEKFYTESTLAKTPPENAWILQKTPDDPEDPFRAPTLGCPVAPFTTGFENATPESLQAFAEGLEERPNIRNKEVSTFVVLDQQSLEDGTCLVYNHHIMKAPGHEDDEWEEDTPTVWVWKPWRVKFVMAWFLCAGFWHNADLVLELLEEGKDRYINDRGIVTFADLEHDKRELPDWEDPSPYGPGAKKDT